MTNELQSQGKNGPNEGWRRGRRRFSFVLLFLALIAAAVWIYWYLYLRGYTSTDDAFIDADAMTISSKMLGRLTLLAVDEGDSVEPGQLLVGLDESDLKAQEAQARAGLEFSRQNVPVAKINIDRAQDDYNRASFQHRNSIITTEQFDHAERALELAQAQYKVALRQVNTAEAQVAVLETQLGNTRILSPMSGVVAKKWVVPGDIVQPGQPIYTLYDLDDVWITANFEETKLQSINLGDSVRIFVDAFPSWEFSGRVVLIGAATASQFSLIPPNNASGNFTKVTQRVPVKIAFDHPAPGDSLNGVPLLPGMSVEVKVVIEKDAK